MWWTRGALANEAKAAGLSGCCSDQVEDSALRYTAINSGLSVGGEGGV
jgi:hypothetical protein